MLEAQTCIQVPLAQLQIVFSKAGNVLFLHLGVGLWNDVLLVQVVTLALCACCLRPAAQHTLPDGIIQH